MPRKMETSLRRHGRKLARQKGMKPGTKTFDDFVGKYVYGSDAMQNWEKGKKKR